MAGISEYLPILCTIITLFSQWPHFRNMFSNAFTRFLCRTQSCTREYPKSGQAMPKTHSMRQQVESAIRSNTRISIRKSDWSGVPSGVEKSDFRGETSVTRSRTALPGRRKQTQLDCGLQKPQHLTAGSVVRRLGGSVVRRLSGSAARRLRLRRQRRRRHFGGR